MIIAMKPLEESSLFLPNIRVIPRYREKADKYLNYQECPYYGVIDFNQFKRSAMICRHLFKGFISCLFCILPVPLLTTLNITFTL